MGRRLLFFGFGALISILFLNFGPENRMQKVFYDYVDYYNPDKRVITQLSDVDSIVYFNMIGESSLNKFYDGAWVNHELTDENSYPQFFVLENIVENKNQRVSINFYDRDKKIEIINFEQGIEISSRSYITYYALTGIFFLIMIPVSLLVRKLIRKRS
jgi:hypothetical protein